MNTWPDGGKFKFNIKLLYRNMWPTDTVSELPHRVAPPVSAHCHSAALPLKATSKTKHLHIVLEDHICELFNLYL